MSSIPDYVTQEARRLQAALNELRAHEAHAQDVLRDRSSTLEQVRGLAQTRLDLAARVRVEAESLATLILMRAESVEAAQ